MASLRLLQNLLVSIWGQSLASFKMATGLSVDEVVDPTGTSAF